MGRFRIRGPRSFRKSLTIHALLIIVLGVLVFLSRMYGCNIDF